MSRIHAFEGILNFRDFGDYPAAGRRMRKGVLFRSGHHARASDSDLDALARLGFSTVVDLRRPIERQEHPSRRWPGHALAIIEDEQEALDQESWRDFIKTSDLTADDFRGHALRFYRTAPFEPHYSDLFRRYFAALATADGAVLVHCMGGKDRTGMLVAFTHTLLGVHQDDIVADFLLTNDSNRFEREAPHFMTWFTDVIGRAPTMEALRIAMGVEAQYLEAAFAVATERCGSVENYMRDVLGVGAPKRAAIESRLLE